MDIFNQLADQKLKKERENRKFLYERFIDDLIDLIEEKPDLFVKEIYPESSDGRAQRNGDNEVVKPVSYTGNNIRVSPEPINFIKKFDHISNNQQTCRKLFQKISTQDFKMIVLDKKPRNNIWFNETSQCINLRPGIAETADFRMQAIQLGNVNVHGLIAGRTGSGKSVFLNTIIQNLLTEYAPWELDIYLADFKKVELSRYVTRYKTPHINAVAATSEIRYVISLFEYLVDCMKARESLFTYLGVQNLKEFRQKFNVVLPRVILIVDEFQQMFQESTFRESEYIKIMLTSIAKLGRATGFHLLFASQDMSGSLSSRVMANFKLRFSLPADSSVSTEILGNPEASNIDVGYVLANDKSGAIEDNVKYRVPYINDDEDINDDGTSKDSYFYERLKLFVDENAKLNFTKQQKFYQEDYQEDILELQKTLKQIKSARKDVISNSSGQYLDVFTLGYGVVYSNKQYDLETVFIETGLNKNILVVSPDISDVAYVQELLAYNFRSFPRKNQKHSLFNFNLSVKAHSDLEKILNFEKITDEIAEIENIKNKYNFRKAVTDAYNSSELKQFMEIFISSMTTLNKFSRQEIERLHKYKETILHHFNDVENYEIEERLVQLEKIYRKTDYSPVKFFIDSMKQEFQGLPNFEQDVYWISTLDYLEKLPRWYSEVLRNSTDLNMLFINFIASDELSSEIVNRSEYIFISGSIEKLYNRCGVDFTNKGLNSIVIDFKIKSLNTQRSFKKYRVLKENLKAPALDFDSILEGE